MAEQHNDHCMMVLDDGWWRIAGRDNEIVILSCPTGCCSATFTLRGWNADAYCDAASMNLRAEMLRQERGSIPATLGSGARN